MKVSYLEVIIMLIRSDRWARPFTWFIIYSQKTWVHEDEQTTVKRGMPTCYKNNKNETLWKNSETINASQSGPRYFQGGKNN